MIKISIVVITKNNPRELDDTLNSLDMQTHKQSLELIIVNGGEDIQFDLKKMNMRFKLLRDEGFGIYDAMNIGLRNSDGDHVLILNSGDKLNNKTSIESIMNLNLSPNCGYFLICKIVGSYFDWRIPSSPKNIEKMSGVPVHQAILFNKKFYKINYYNTKFKIASDYDYKLKFFKYENVKFIPIEFSDHVLGGVSSSYTLKNFITISKELFEIDFTHNRPINYLVNQFNIIIKFLLYQCKLLRYMELLIKKKYSKSEYEFKI
jgi:glycosyltransferase involved in cell wall biosynthesis